MGWAVWQFWLVFDMFVEVFVVGEGFVVVVIDFNIIVGCMDEVAFNYDFVVIQFCEDCCIYEIVGCMDLMALNFNFKVIEFCMDCCDYL